ncbi:DNA methyltransferase [Methanoculleus frigidifontis]|nr:DNA methyltransferase [Methanoculleus sp. FWC-SCC1]
MHPPVPGRPVTPEAAAAWASAYTGKTVTPSKIRYLIQYGRLRRHSDGDAGGTLVDLAELASYYREQREHRTAWQEQLGDDLNWDLSFDQCSETETTKHVHRLHPYKGKFIPQLVEYFLDDHTDAFKTGVFFRRGDIVLDPFMGSGTTLVQAAEMGLHAVGIDISAFNCMIVRAKFTNGDLIRIGSSLRAARAGTEAFSRRNFDDACDRELKKSLAAFNAVHFPPTLFRRRIHGKPEEEQAYGEERLALFLCENASVAAKDETRDDVRLIDEDGVAGFLSEWFSPRIRQEMACYLRLIDGVPDEDARTLMRIILSRTARSCRATTHYDLATLKERQVGPYYCYKHKKLCTPIGSICKHLRKNTLDTIARLEAFAALRQDVQVAVLHGDARTIDIPEAVRAEDPAFADRIATRQIDGVFTSPPYVGHIDYHEQHAYAYELFGIPRRDAEEIGSLSSGTGRAARRQYVAGVARVLANVAQFVRDDGNFFIVANDKFDLYPAIARESGLAIADRYKRPVLNRTARDRRPYAEFIFRMVKR